MVPNQSRDVLLTHCMNIKIMTIYLRLIVMLNYNYNAICTKIKQNIF